VDLRRPNVFRATKQHKKVSQQVTEKRKKDKHNVNVKKKKEWHERQKSSKKKVEELSSLEGNDKTVLSD
jgi:hypothetical protein